jgi:DNA-binding transcriptional MerR regulator
MAAMERDSSRGEPGDLIPIGRFARLSGLSIGALRHYDELDLLRPADVDRFTGYRRYRPDQLETARAIARLRDLEVPIEEIRAVLGSDDPTEQRRRIEDQRRRAQARADRLHYQLHVLTQLSSGKEPLVSARTVVDPATDLTPEVHRRLGTDLFNYVWTLIEKPDRTPAEIDEMIHAVHAQVWHWSKAGTTVHLGRGEWQIARVYSVLGWGHEAVFHAGRCVAYAEQAHASGETESWDLAGAYEAMARALAVAGDRAAAEGWRDRAKAAVAAIEDADDREPIEQDIATLPL